MYDYMEVRCTGIDGKQNSRLFSSWGWGYPAAFFAFQDGKFVQVEQYCNNTSNNHIFFIHSKTTGRSPNLESIAQMVEEKYGLGFKNGCVKPSLYLEIDGSEDQPGAQQKLDRMALEFANTSTDEMCLSGILKLYRVTMKRVTDPAEVDESYAFIKRKTLSNESDKRNRPEYEPLWRYLAQFWPVVTLVDEVEIQFDHRDYDLKVRIAKPGEDFKLLRKREAGAYASLLNRNEWLDKNKNPYFSAVASAMGTLSFRSVITQLGKSPDVRLCWLECHNLIPVERYLSSKTLRFDLDDGVSPAKKLGLSKMGFKIINGILDVDPSFKESGFSILVSAFKIITKRYNDQIAENFLSLLQKYHLELVHTGIQNHRNKDLVLQASDLASFIARFGGPKGKSFDMDKCLNYLCYEIDTYQGITSIREGIQLLKDYYNSLTQMDIKVTDYFPRSLKLAHDVAARNFRLVEEELSAARFKKQVENSNYQELAYSDKDYAIVLPTCGNDLVIEGARQHHCVGSYVHYITEGSKHICFMRHADDLETPVLTLEVDPVENSLVQYSGACNRAPSKEEMAWLRKWCRIKGLDIR